MTVPSGARRNWCPACEDACDGHALICTVCGTELQYPRSGGSGSGGGGTNNSSGNTLPPPPRINVLPVPAELGMLDNAEALRAASREIRERLGSVRERIRETGQEQNELLEEILTMQRQALAGAVDGEQWQDVPAAWLDQQQQTSGRPTSKGCLDRIPRIVLRDESALFRRASLSLLLQHQPNNGSPSDNDSNARSPTTTTTTIKTVSAVPGEFGNEKLAATATGAGGARVLARARLIVAEPRTGKGGILSDRTLRAVQEAQQSQPQSQPQQQRPPSPPSATQESTESNEAATAAPAVVPVVMYMERGDGITFVQKAVIAQRAGASAVVIANDRDDPWPYAMKDSSDETSKLGLQIPVVMVKRSDGRDLVARYNETTTAPAERCRFLECALKIEANDGNECVVCREAFEVGQTVVRLPDCAHVFHEPCALMWLTSHNTCPYCRRELPTDDEEYEQTRRREQRTHAGGSSTGGSQGAADSFYG